MPSKSTVWDRSAARSSSSRPTASPTARPPGRYVAVAYFSYGRPVEARSAEFDIAPLTNATTVTPTHPTFYAGQQLSVAYTNMLGNESDAIAVAYPDSPPGYADLGAWIWYNPTEGRRNRTMSFPSLDVGTYVARAFYATQDQSDAPVVVESAPFDVIPPPTPTVSTDERIYLPSDTIVVSFGNMAGDPNDVIALADSDDGDQYMYAQTGGVTGGMLDFSGLAPGQYAAGRERALRRRRAVRPDAGGFVAGRQTLCGPRKQNVVTFARSPTVACASRNAVGESA
jgi:hypothetical protein